ncbi:MAG: alternative ribosome rescue aminoacyl-tRNA hydrolase ArfB [Planctomycetota bacterium]
MVRDLLLIHGLRIPGSEVTLTFARSGGPGGQNVNKVASKAVLRWSLGASSLSEDVKSRLAAKLAAQITNTGDIVISASEYRDAPRNAEAAVSRLELMLNNALRVAKKRKATKPKYGSVVKRLEHKRAHGNLKKSRRVSGDE